MNTFEIVSALDAEIARLQQAKNILQGIAGTGKRVPGRPVKLQDSLDKILTAKPAKKRKLSAEGRARIAAAQKARWAARQTPEKVAPAKATAPAKKASTKAVKKVAAKQ